MAESNPKIDPQLELAIDISDSDLKDNNLSLGYDEESENWEVIVKYYGNLDGISEDLNAEVEILSDSFAIITLNKNQIDKLAQYNEIEYVERPRRLLLMLNNSLRESCVTSVRENYPELTGKGVLVGIIDSGIDFTHPDFRNDDGSSRILYIWDQSIEGNPPQGFTHGTEYTNEDINNALNASNPIETGRIVPHRDNIGHGTHISGIAAGNGRASRGTYRGIAYESSLIVVKLGEKGRESFARTTELMRAVKYMIDKSLELNMPIAINISFGTNDGSHDGKSLFEQYLNDMSNIGKNVIVVATGNEGASAHHYENKVENNQTIEIEFVIAEGLTSVFLTLWKSYIDKFNIEVISPSGISSGIISFTSRNNRFTLGNADLYVLQGGPTPYNRDQEIFFELRPISERLTEGIWKINITGYSIVEGNFNIWLPVTEASSNRSFFVNPSVYTTLTIPSTAENVISVGGYNSSANSISDFSGRGFPRGNNFVKPDIAAPAENIRAPMPGGGYDALTGTSIAAPFVTGSCAILMQWGIINGNDPFLYGQKLKAYLQLGASRSQNIKYPNREWGYGRLCLSDTLYNLELTDRMNTQNIISIQEINNPENSNSQIPNGTIQDAIYSEDYYDFVIEYNSTAEIIINNSDFIKFCNVITGEYAVIFISRNEFKNFFSSREGEMLIGQRPFLMGLMSTSSLEASGILRIQNQPNLNLRGQGILIGIVDTGIDYTKDVFKFEDGTTKIRAIWDQTIVGENKPNGQCYGTEYTQEDINNALRNNDPFSVVPTKDEIGHGTFLASVAAAREDTENDFIGAAPDSELLVVKLKTAKQNLRNDMLIPTDAIAYESSDLMTGIEYIYNKSVELQMPVSICIGLGTNEGGHNGLSIIENMISDIGVRNGVFISVANGNEANAKHHALIRLTENEDFNTFEIRVDENEEGFPIFIWSYVPDIISVGITSPGGQTIERIRPTDKLYQEFNLVLANTTVVVQYYIPVLQGSDQLTIIKLINPTPGIWSIRIYGDSVFLGAVHAWLPITGFIRRDTSFLTPDPSYTATVPSSARIISSVGGYNHNDESIYINSGRGPTRLNVLRPYFCAPAVNVGGIGLEGYTSYTGTSVAAALTAGAAALVLEWGLIRANNISLNSASISSYFIRGAERKQGEVYPNNLWGFGTLDLYQSFENIL